MEHSGHRANEQTIFHLIPLNRKTSAILSQASNERHVSFTADAQLGLEVGYHVSRKLGGRTITTVGRKGDIVIEDRSVSKTHIEFQMHEGTKAVILSTQGTTPADVLILAMMGDREDNFESVEDRYMLVFCQRYEILIRGEYRFLLVWQSNVFEDMKDKVEREYAEALTRANYLTSADQDTQYDKLRAESYYLTRFRTREAMRVEEDVRNRVDIGHGGFGAVFSTTDKRNIEKIAVKVIKLNTGSAEEDERTQRERLHREVNALKDHAHPNIIELIDVKGFWEQAICVYMPLRDGSLRDLTKDGPLGDDQLCYQVMHQMLQALDFLAYKKFCHRDVKPANILYSVLDASGPLYRFQLADFGLSRSHGTAHSMSGTEIFKAPEVVRGQEQGPKVDVWSLYVTMVAFTQGKRWPPPAQREARLVHKMLREEDYFPQMRIMIREDPRYRASAAQCLVAWYGGDGLSTPQPIDAVASMPEKRDSSGGSVRRSRRMESKAVQEDAPSYDSIFGAAAEARPGPSKRVAAVRRQESRQLRRTYSGSVRARKGPSPPQCKYDGDDVVMGGMGASREGAARGYHLRPRRARN